MSTLDQAGMLPDPHAPWLRQNTRPVRAATGNANFWVPKYVYRVDHDATHGWSVRVPGHPTRFFSDRVDGNQRATPRLALDAAIEHLKSLYPSGRDARSSR